MQINQLSAYMECFKPLSRVSMMHRNKKFGERGNEALMKELRQLHDRKAMVPKKMSYLRRTGKRHFGT